MRRVAASAIALAVLLPLGACTSDEYVRQEGVTSGVGDAIAADTALQMVDPWPRGVEQTNLRVPADQKQYEPASSPAAAAAPSTSGASTTND